MLTLPLSFHGGANIRGRSLRGMRAGILIGTAAAALGVMASGAPAYAEPCPPEICYVPGIPGVPSGVLNMLPQSMGDLPPQLSQYPGGWGDQSWGGWNQRDSIDIYNTPAPEAPVPAPGGIVPQPDPPAPLPGD